MQLEDFLGFPKLRIGTEKVNGSADGPLLNEDRALIR